MQLQELIRLAAGRLIHDFRDAQRQKRLGHGEGGFVERAPVPAVQRPGANQSRVIERERRAGIGKSICGDRARAIDARVRAVGRIVNGPFGCGHGQAETARHIAARLIEAGNSHAPHIRVEKLGLVLSQDDGRTLREIGIRQSVEFRKKIPVPGERIVDPCRHAISPAGRFEDDGGIDLGNPLEVGRSGTIALGVGGINGRLIGVHEEGPAIEELFLDMVGELEPVLGIVLQEAVNCGWRYALVIADNVFVHVLQRDFGIPAHEFIACAGGAVAQGVPVVVGPIRIARVVVNDHVIDKAVNIEVLFDLVVLRVVGQARVDQRHHRRPGNVISRDHLEEALRVAHHVVLGVIAAIVSGAKTVVGPLVDVI